MILSLAAPALGGHAEESLVRGFIERLDKSPGWKASAARIGSTAALTIVEGLKIDREDGSANAEVATVTLDSLVLREGGGISLQAFTLTGSRLSGANWSFTAPAVTGKNLIVPGIADWSFEPKAPFTSLARFYTILATTEFSAIDMPSAAFAQSLALPDKAGTSKTTATYKDMHLGALAGGVLAGPTVARVEQNSAIAGTSVTSTMENIAVNGISLAAVARVFDPAAYAGGKGDGQWIKALESGSYGRITVSEGGREHFSMGPITIGSIEVRQTPEPFALAFDQAVSMGEKPSPAEMSNFLEANASNLLGWMRLTSLNFRNLKGTSPEAGAFTLDDLGIADISSDGLKRLNISGFAATAPEFSASLKSFEIGDIIWPSLKAFRPFVGLEESKKAGSLDPQAAAEAAETFMTIFPKIGHIALSGLSAGVPGGEPLSLDSYEATLSGKYALLPEKTDSRIGNLTIPHGMLAATPESRELFDALGYKKLVLHAEGTGSYDEATGRYATGTKLGVDDAGALHIAYALAALTPARLTALLTPIFMAGSGEPDPALLMHAAGPIALESFTLRFEDASLTRRLLAYAAKLQGIDEQTLISNMAALAQLGIGTMGQPEFTAAAIGAMTSFLKDPRSITFSVAPAKPVEIQELMALDPANPGAAITLLGISVKAND